MAIDVQKPSVDESVVKYQARTVLLQLASDVSLERVLTKPDVKAKIKKAIKIRRWLKALDNESGLTYEQRYLIVYKLIEISGVNNFPTSPILALHTRPSILIGGGGGGGSVPALELNNFVFGTGTGIGTKSIYTGNDNVFVNMSTTPSTINSPSLINNTFLLTERAILNPVTTITGAFSVGDWHTLGDGVNAFSGSGGFNFGFNGNNYGVGAFVGGVGAQVNYGSTNSSGFGFGLGGAVDRLDATYKYVTAGPAAVNISHNTTSQTSGNGALGLYSGIFVGQDHHIPATSPRSAIIGGNAIVARASDPDQVYVPNINIVSTPLNDNALVQILARDASTGQVKYRNSATLANPDALILETTMTRTATDFVDRLTLVNLEYDYITNQTFRIQTYGTGTPNYNVGFQVDAADNSASLLANDAGGRQGYFKVFNPSALQAKATSATNSITMDIQAGSWATTGAGSNNVWTLNGFKTAQFNFTGVNAGFGVNVDNSGGSSGLINFTVTNTNATEPLIMLLTQNTSATPINSGIRLFGTSATGNVIVAKNTIGDSQWGSINLASSAAVGSSILGTVNGGTGSGIQNFVDLSTNQTGIAGNKSWTGLHTFSGSGNQIAIVGNATYNLQAASATNDFRLFENAAVTNTKFIVGANAQPAATLQVRGSTNNGTGVNFRFEDSAGTSRLTMTDQGVITHVGIIGSSVSSPINNNLTLTVSGTGTTASPRGAFSIVYNSFTMNNPTSHNEFGTSLQGTITTSNTNQTYRAFSLGSTTFTYTANHTGAALRGFYWNPTIAGTQAGSVSHLSMEIVSGTALMKAALAATFGPSATGSGISTETLQVRNDQNSSTWLGINNGTNGTSSNSAIIVRAGASDFADAVGMYSFAPSFTTSGMNEASKGAIISTNLSGLNIGTSINTPFEFWTNNTLRGQFTSGGAFVVGSGALTSGSVLVDLQSTTLGVLMPRVTNVASVTTPVNSMIVYDAATNKFNFRENGVWNTILTSSTAWLTASGGTATGNNLFAFGGNLFQATSTVANSNGGYRWTNTFTAGGSSQSGTVFDGTITGDGVNISGPQGIWQKNTFITGLASQALNGVVIGPTFQTDHASASATALVISPIFTGTQTATASKIALSIASGQSRISDKVYIGTNNTTAATAYLHLGAGTATANTAPLKFTSGTNLTTAEAGAVEYDGTNFFATNGTATRYTLAKTLTATAALNFPSTGSDVSSDLTITVTGAATGDVVVLGVPAAAVNANSCYTAWVSAANTVTVRFNNYSIAAIDPASATFRVSVLQY